jgi:hypothetical protein
VNFDKNVTTFFQPATRTQISFCIISNQEAFVMKVKQAIFTDHERSGRFLQISFTGALDEHKGVDSGLQIFIIDRNMVSLRYIFNRNFIRRGA